MANFACIGWKHGPTNAVEHRVHFDAAKHDHDSDGEHPAAQVNLTTGVTDLSNAIQNIVKAGGFFLPGTTEWIPYGMIVSITAS